jgi:hypothetical protein
MSSRAINPGPLDSHLRRVVAGPPSRGRPCQSGKFSDALVGSFLGSVGHSRVDAPPPYSAGFFVNAPLNAFFSCPVSLNYGRS